MANVIKAYSNSLLQRFPAMSKPLLIVISLFVAVAILISILAVTLQPPRPVALQGAEKIFQGRDFESTPFGLMDAYDACTMEAKSKLGDSMLRANILPLSTRYDTDNNTYLIVIDADIGTIQSWSDATIYCDIDPEEQKLSYYKEIIHGEPSILSRTISFLGSVLD